MSYSDFADSCLTREEWEAARDEMAGQTLEDNALTLATNGLYWMSAAQWMDHPGEVKKTFMDAFMKPGTMKARMTAAMGLSAANHGPAQAIIDSAREIQRKMDAGGSPAPGGDCNAALTALGAAMVRVVDGGHHTTLTNAAKLLKGDSEAPKKGAFSQVPGEVWKAFCQHHLETGLLPTKKQLDNLSGVKDGRKIRGPLGLNGLPEVT